MEKVGFEILFLKHFLNCCSSREKSCGNLSNIFQINKKQNNENVSDETATSNAEKSVKPVDVKTFQISCI